MIPFIPSNAPVVQGPPSPPPEPDLDGYPKRSLCVHCTDPIAQAVKDGPWTFGNGRECAKAPNPDEGPMPGHEPGLVLHPPKKT